MPVTNNWWQNIQKLFQGPSNIELLEIELKKDLSKQQPDQIQKLVRNECLKQEAFPMHLFEINPDVLIQALERIIREAPFDKKIIYHASWDAFEQAKKQLGEVHCVLVSSSADSIINFGGEPPYAHGIGYAILNEGYHYLDIQTEPADLASFIEPIDSPNNKALLDTELTRRGFILTNIHLITHARRELEKYYFNVANDAFLKSDQPPCLETALKACLHLSSSENGEDSNTQFKNVIAEIYFADNAGNMQTIPAIIFSSLKTSHQNPTSTFEFLQGEKQKMLKS